MKHIAKFEKVSFEQFARAYAEYAKEHPDCIQDPSVVYDKIKLPKRATVGSAGYDFFAPMDITISPGKTVKVPTGIRVRINPGWVLMCYPRSGLGFKYRLQLDNTVGVIDSDYYGSDNEGHIFLKLTNDTHQGRYVEIKAGAGIAQGIFTEYGITEDDEVSEVRNGGFGSTSKSEDNSVENTGVVDDNLLCESGDCIDNAVFNIIREYVQHKDFSGAVLDAAEALCPDLKDDKVVRMIFKTCCDSFVECEMEAKILDLLDQHGYAFNEIPEWDMELIGDLTDFLGALLEECGMHVCHPWEDQDGHICYSTSDRCEYCKKPDAGSEDDPDRPYEVTEVCPECESENTFIWNIDEDGYSVYCPHCGSRMMLCDACIHAADNPKGVCDWSEEAGCFRNRKKKGNLK